VRTVYVANVCNRRAAELRGPGSGPRRMIGAIGKDRREQRQVARSSALMIAALTSKRAADARAGAGEGADRRSSPAQRSSWRGAPCGGWEAASRGESGKRLLVKPLLTNFTQSCETGD
jgi:hypothetical protein